MGFVSAGVIIGYPSLGLKLPQKDNPFYMRKKFVTTTTIQQFQELAMLEYGGKIEKMPESNVMYSHKGFQMVGKGIRIDLDSYKDLIC